MTMPGWDDPARIVQTQGCRASHRVAAEPDLARRPRIGLQPVRDYPPYVYGSPDVFPPGHPGYDQGVAADLDIPAVLREELESWIEQWRENFLHPGDRPVDQPVWRNGFYVMAWLDRGNALADRLQELCPDHLAFCCVTQYVVCELVAEQHDYVCPVRREYVRENGWRIPGNEPDPDEPGPLRLMPEDGVEWGIWSGRLRYYEPPRLRGPGPVGFSTPRSLGLSRELEERLRRWNEDWRRGFVDYADESDSTGRELGLPEGGWGLPRWGHGVEPTAWYREGREIARMLAQELPGVEVTLWVDRYVYALRPRRLTGRLDGVNTFLAGVDEDG